MILPMDHINKQVLNFPTGPLSVFRLWRYTRFYCAMSLISDKTNDWALLICMSLGKLNTVGTFSVILQGRQLL